MKSRQLKQTYQYKAERVTVQRDRENNLVVVETNSFSFVKGQIVSVEMLTSFGFMLVAGK